MSSIAQITRVVVRRYRDNGQTKVYVEWTDTRGKTGTTSGDPSSLHMAALIEHAKRRGVLIEHETW